MSSAKITMIGLENYLNKFNDSLFSRLVLPSGIDKETLTDNILLRSGEFEILYSNPVFMQNAINLWSKKNYRTFDKWVKALNIDYNPLENYDRIEDITRKNTGTVKNTGTESNTGTVKNTGTESNTGTVKNTGTETNAGNSTETIANNTIDKVSAFDSDTLRTNTSQDVTGSDTIVNSGTRTDDLTRTDNLTRTDDLTRTDNLTRTDDLTRTDNLTEITTARLHGNIGVTTSQQMLESELDIATWNLYEQITDLFTSEFCITVY